MAKKILIVEDLVGALVYYRPLFLSENEVSVLILSSDKKYTGKDIREYLDLFVPDVANEIKNYFVRNEADIREFLRENTFDFYVMDSLGGMALELAELIGMPNEKVVFLSGTSSFREDAAGKGFRAYKKEDIDRLISECL